MKTILTSLLIWIAVASLFYLGFSFVAMEFNAAKWTEESRFVLAICAISFSGLFNLMYISLSDD